MEGTTHEATNPTNHAVNQRIEEAKLEVVREELAIDKQSLVTGTLTVSRTTEVTPREVELTDVTYGIREERHPINQVVESPPAIRTEGNTVIVPVVREEAVVVTRLVLVEEIHYIRERNERSRTETIDVREHRVSVDRR